jgi:hypothetical protein
LVVAKYIKICADKATLFLEVVNRFQSLFLTFSFKLSIQFGVKYLHLLLSPHLCYVNSSFKQVAAFRHRCQSIFALCMVQPQVKNALAKAVHVTDCTTCRLTGMIQKYVVELYRTAVFAVDICGLSVVFTNTCL